MNSYIEKQVHLECDLYEKLDAAFDHAYFVEFVIKNKWTLLNILEEYGESMRELRVNV